MENALSKTKAPAQAAGPAGPETATKAAKPYARHPDRITINAEALARINTWVAELEGRRIAVSRNQLVNWLLCHHEAALSPLELRDLEAAFFNEVRFAEWALRELKAAQGCGEAVTLAEIIARHRPAEKLERTNGQIKVKRSRTQSKNGLQDRDSDSLKPSVDTLVQAQESCIFLDKNVVK